MPRSVKTVKINPHTLEMWTTVVVESEEREASKSEEREAPRGRGNLVQTALAGEVGEYQVPDHSVGESFPGRQPSTVQLSLFDAGVTNAVDGFPKKYRVSSVPKCDKP